MKEHIDVGPIEIRFDFLLVVAGISIASSPVMGACFAVAIVAHELGHGVASRFTGRKLRVVLQLAGGRIYGQHAGVLFAGLAASGALVFAGARLIDLSPQWGYALFFASLVWTGYQLAPFPTTDGGQLLRMFLEPRLKRAAWIWRLSWFLGFAYVAGVVALDAAFIEPSVWLTGVALILGRGEAGYVRHVDAWNAWEVRDYARVIDRVRSAPDYLDKRDRVPLFSLGLSAALELEDVGAVQEMAGRLPPNEPAVIEAATWLLRREHAYGAKLAERALDALDAERVKRAVIDEELWSEMTFRLAVFEALELRPESALGLLERAIELGYENEDRIEAEPAFARLESNPRYDAILKRLR